MALWGRKVELELPDSLKDKKPEEILAALQKAEQMENDLKTAKEQQTALQQKLDQQATEFTTIKDKLTALEANSNRKTPEELAAEAAAAAAVESPSPWSDPEAFVAEQTKGITNVALASGMMTAKMYFTQNLSPRDQKIFKKFEKEVDNVLGTFPVAQRVMPQAWLNAFLYVKGLHEQDIQKAESEKTDFFSEQVTRTGGDNTPPPDAEKLTPEELEVCRVMHWDPKGYLERKKQGVLAQSGKGSYAKFAVEVAK